MKMGYGTLVNRLHAEEVFVNGVKKFRIDIAYGDGACRYWVEIANGGSVLGWCMEIAYGNRGWQLHSTKRLYR